MLCVKHKGETEFRGFPTIGVNGEERTEQGLSTRIPRFSTSLSLARSHNLVLAMITLLSLQKRKDIPPVIVETRRLVKTRNQEMQILCLTLPWNFFF